VNNVRIRNQVPGASGIGDGQRRFYRLYAWSGVDLLSIQAVTFVDIPMMATHLCLTVLVFVGINLTLDFLHSVVYLCLRIERPAAH
jgi:hypothetical protein